MDEHRVQQVRQQIRGVGYQWELTNLPFSDEEKETIVEYLAWKLYQLLSAIGVPDGGWKGYDPLTIERGVAHSYVFDLGDEGRHHAFRDLSHLEQLLLAECATTIKEHFQPQEAS